MYDINALPERFRNKIEVTDDCWLWKASAFPNGYGQFKVKNINWKAHRYSYTQFFGDIPDNLSVLHRCDVRRCVNPAHLWLGTHDENMADCARKGRRAGELNPNAKITAKQAQEIRDLCGCGLFLRKDIAEMYGLTVVMVKYIRTGKNWTNHGSS